MLLGEQLVLVAILGAATEFVFELRQLVLRLLLLTKHALQLRLVAVSVRAVFLSQHDQLLPQVAVLALQLRRP